jgi:hypothetical protein
MGLPQYGQRMERIPGIAWIPFRLFFFNVNTSVCITALLVFCFGQQKTGAPQKAKQNQALVFGISPALTLLSV